MCSLDDVETCAVWLQESRRAAKQHKCTGCGIRIERGEKHTITKMLFDGRWDTERGCRHCTRAQTAFGEAHHHTPNLSTLEEFLTECAMDGQRNDAETRRWGRLARGILKRRRVSEVVAP